MKLQGKVWKFGDNINTDLIIPARYMTAYEAAELGKHCMEDADPKFSKKVKPGDIIIAGENFGCGSSREHAVLALKGAGVSAVIAKSFARIFFRNAINTGLPIIESSEAASAIKEGAEIVIDLTAGKIEDKSENRTFTIKEFPKFLTEIVENGGLLKWATGKKSYKIGVIPGDGVGPEIIREGLKVLEAVRQKFSLKFELVNYDFGGERYLKTGEILPDSAIEEFRKLDAIYLGAVGHPDVKTGILEHGLLLKLRFALDQYINLRPVKLYPGVWTPIKDKGPEQIDYVVVRENTEGAYTGMGGCFKKGTPDEIAVQEDVNTRKGVERCIRYAYKVCQRRSRMKKITCCDKANVLTHAGDLWRRTLVEVGKEFPGIKQDYAFVDATTMWMIKNPEWFDVIVTSNIFGDIITDLAAVTQGGLGIAAGGNINPEGVSMFEPIHGSAPKYTGQNVICPVATIAAAGMMLDTLGETEAALAIDAAVAKATGEGHLKSLEAKKMGMSTSEVGDLLARFISEQ